MTSPARILLVDDTPENLDVLSAILEDLNCQLIIATNGERALELSARHYPDLILLDVMMPGMNGFDVCNALKANPATAEIPIIFVTARTDDVSVGFAVGGNDYIAKPINADEVRARVRHQLERKALIVELKSLNKELELKVRARTADLTIANQQLRNEINERRYMQDRLNYLATHDFVTRLHNRNSLESHVCDLLAKIQAQSTKASFLLIDIDQFRVINESCGCIAGDELLRQFSEVVNGLLSKEDHFARLGGDKFAIVAQHSDADNSLDLARLILKQINSFTFIWEHRTFNLAVSIAHLPLSTEIVSFDQTLLQADEVMFMAKNEGRGTLCTYQETIIRAKNSKNNINWALRLVDALQNKHLRAHFQVIEDFFPPQTPGEKKIRIETLIRLWDPERETLIQPNVFIGPAERLHLIPKLDLWMIGEVMSLFGEHPDLVAQIDLVSMNLSSVSIREPHFADDIINLIEKNKIPPQLVCFEITETEAILNVATANEFMKRLHDFGCQFALDDFGSGFASYAYLHQLAFDTLKIDGVFVRDMDRDLSHQAMVRSIVEMGKSLNKNIVAEFVETENIALKLKELGVKWGQGFLYHKPEALTYESLRKHAQ